MSTGLKWLIALIVTVLAAVAAFSIYRAFQNPEFIVGLVGIFAGLVAGFVLKPETPEARKLRQELERRNEVPPTKQRPHPGEGHH